MRCRSIVQNEATKKQNIVFFGSCGKNTDYVPQDFSGFDAMNPPVIEDNGTKKSWQNVYPNYYVITQGPFLNMSEQWGETPIWPAEDLFPSDSLLPNSGSAIEYFKLDEATGTFIPVLSMPSDWKENYGSYYIARFEKNTDPAFDPSKTYYAYGNKIPAQNYSSGSKGVRDSLIQRLSVIKGELWYKASYGLPLAEKIKNKGIYDSVIIAIITSHPDVKNIIEFESSISKAERSYKLRFSALTVYGDELEVRYSI